MKGNTIYGNYKTKAQILTMLGMLFSNLSPYYIEKWISSHCIFICAVFWSVS